MDPSKLVDQVFIFALNLLTFLIITKGWIKIFHLLKARDHFHLMIQTAK